MVFLGSNPGKAAPKTIDYFGYPGLGAELRFATLRAVPILSSDFVVLGESGSDKLGGTYRVDCLSHDESSSRIRSRIAGRRSISLSRRPILYTKSA